MSRFAKLFATNAIGIAGLGVAVALSSPAVADPAAAPAVPSIPALSMVQDLATNPASVGAVLQTAASALNGASTMVGAPAPSALPVSPIQGAPATPPVPMPATAALGPASGLVPILNQFGVPAQLVNLAPTQLLGLGAAAPAAPVATMPTAPMPVAPMPTAPIATFPTAPMAPAAAIPAAPIAPAAAPVNPLSLITALP